MRCYVITLVIALVMVWPRPVGAHVATTFETTGTFGVSGALALVFMISLAGAYGRGLGGMWRRAGVGRGIRQWQAACFCLGILVLFAALVQPLDPLSQSSLSLHMVQHMLLIAVAAPLLVLGKPLAPVLLGFREVSRARLLKWWRSFEAPRFQILTQPPVATTLHGIIIWFWHAPFFYNLALADEIVHIVEHMTFLGSALLFWWALLHSGSRMEGFGSSVLAALMTLMHTGVLGALLTFAPAPLYERYGGPSPSGLSPLEEQQLAGLIMWIPGSVVYLIGGLALIAMGLESARRQRVAAHPPNS